MGPDGLQLVLGFNTSAGEQVASWAPGAFVFKTLTRRVPAIWPRPPIIGSVMLAAGEHAALTKERVKAGGKVQL
jgi:hypothetical protein